MRKRIGLLVILAVAGLCITAAAQEVDKTVIPFRSVDDPDVETGMRRGILKIPTAASEEAL